MLTPLQRSNHATYTAAHDTLTRIAAARIRRGLSTLEPAERTQAAEEIISLTLYHVARWLQSQSEPVTADELRNITYQRAAYAIAEYWQERNAHVWPSQLDAAPEPSELGPEHSDAYGLPCPTDQTPEGLCAGLPEHLHPVALALAFIQPDASTAELVEMCELSRATVKRHRAQLAQLLGQHMLASRVAAALDHVITSQAPMSL